MVTVSMIAVVYGNEFFGEAAMPCVQTVQENGGYVAIMYGPTLREAAVDGRTSYDALSARVGDRVVIKKLGSEWVLAAVV